MDILATVLASMETRSDTPPVIRAAIAASNGNLQRANDELADALSESFWRKPYLLAKVVVGIPIWPCGFSPVELLEICRTKRAEQIKASSYTGISLLAAERTLTRIIDESARLHIEETLETVNGH